MLCYSILRHKQFVMSLLAMSLGDIDWLCMNRKGGTGGGAKGWKLHSHMWDWL